MRKNKFRFEEFLGFHIGSLEKKLNEFKSGTKLDWKFIPQEIPEDNINNLLYVLRYENIVITYYSKTMAKYGERTSVTFLDEGDEGAIYELSLYNEKIMERILDKLSDHLDIFDALIEIDSLKTFLRALEIHYIDVTYQGKTEKARQCLSIIKDSELIKKDKALRSNLEFEAVVKPRFLESGSLFSASMLIVLNIVWLFTIPFVQFLGSFVFSFLLLAIAQYCFYRGSVKTYEKEKAEYSIFDLFKELDDSDHEWVESFKKKEKELNKNRIESYQLWS